MRFIWMFFYVLFIGCSEEHSAFDTKSHEEIQIEIDENYKRNTETFQNLARRVAKYKRLRSVDLKYGHLGTDGIKVLFGSMDRSGPYTSFSIKGNNDKRLEDSLIAEDLSIKEIEGIKNDLLKINCNSFYTLSAPEIHTGTTFTHVEFRYNSWNGVKFYYYKIFDKKLEPYLVQFFDRKNESIGGWKGIGDILDSNAVWYLPYD